MQKKVFIFLLLGFVIGCSTDKVGNKSSNTDIIKADQIPSRDSVNTSYLKKNPNGSVKLNSTNKESVISYILDDLNLALDEEPILSHYYNQLIGSPEKEHIIAVRLEASAFKKYGPFDISNDRLMGYYGKYHYVYVLNPADSIIEKVAFSGSAISPAEISFPKIAPNKYALNIDYRIKEASFKFVYAEIRKQWKMVFATTNYNLKKYESDPLTCNFTKFNTESLENGYYQIELKDSEITNYNAEEARQNYYKFQPEIKEKEGIKRTFFMDTLTWKYATRI